MKNPILSFIVLSYNYENYIGQTIRSILDQTIQDFEIIIVDDASSDRSTQVISAFSDPRIRLLVNSHNLGGAASYNRAVLAASGKYLVNLDADDWIAPRKSELQLRYLERNNVQVLGTYVTFIDDGGGAHTQSDLLNSIVNRPHQLNTIDAWVGQNNLIRSSTIVDRAAHARVGLDDVMMKRACDYELWTRFLGAGYRFAVLDEPLTYYRLHSRGVTHADPSGSLLEISFTMLKNLVPLIGPRSAYPSFSRIAEWIVAQNSFALLKPLERYRLLGCLLTSPAINTFEEFRHTISDKNPDNLLTQIGQRFLAEIMFSQRATDLTESCDYWRTDSSNWKKESENILPLTEARDYWHRESMAQKEIIIALEHERNYWRQKSE